MLRMLVKLTAYGLLGYAIYEFVRGAMGAESMTQALGLRQQGGGGGQRSGGRQGGQQQGERQNLHDQADRANMTGPGEGRRVETQESDGGSVPHAVGRGVVSRS